MRVHLRSPTNAEPAATVEPTRRVTTATTAMPHIAMTPYTVPALAALLGACLVAVPSALAVEFENCAPGSDLAEWTQVSVLGCRSNDTVCTLRRGHDVTISIDFNNKYREWRVHTSVHGIVAGLEMPFEVKHPDACHGTGLTCPLAPGPHTYTYSLFVDHNKPKMRRVVVKWEILNEFNKPLVCVRIPARIR